MRKRDPMYIDSIEKGEKPIRKRNLIELPKPPAQTKQVSITPELARLWSWALWHYASYDELTDKDRRVLREGAAYLKTLFLEEVDSEKSGRA